ncbi:MAG TPA: hypothetical protein VN618_10285 [Solirubrobacteraceae bacterium]|nr:hypothetical protein [Solirubrobacteraceae bacterium]
MKKKTGRWLILLLSIGLIAAATAYALSTNNTRWKVNGAALTSGETHSVTSSAFSTQTLRSSGVEIQCTGVAGSALALTGSNSPNPGGAEGKLKYSGCTVPSFEKCKINGSRPGSFETKNLGIELVYLTKAGAEKEEIANGISAMLVKPKEGTTLAEMSLSPAEECPTGGTVMITGKTGKTGIIFNALAATADEELEVHEIEAPPSSLKTYFTNNGSGTTEEHGGIGIEANGGAATYQGRIRVNAGTGSKYNMIIP